jgi:hypothetical protein
MRIYILSTYEEHGAEDVKATSNPALVDGIITSYDAFKSDVSYERQRAADAIRGDELGSFDLSPGWGGMRLDIVDMVE